MAAAVVAEMWTAPIPPPAVLADLNRIIPDGAERVLAMAERAQAHAMETSSAALTAEIASYRRGQWLGGAISLLAILCATLSVALEAHWTVSIAFLGVPVGGMVKALIQRR